MDVSDVRRVIAPAVVPLGEDVDGVYAAELERRLPTLFVEQISDARDVFRRVEVEVNLAGWQRLVRAWEFFPNDRDARREQ